MKQSTARAAGFAAIVSGAIAVVVGLAKSGGPAPAPPPPPPPLEGGALPLPPVDDGVKGSSTPWTVAVLLQWNGKQWMRMRDSGVARLDASAPIGWLVQFPEVKRAAPPNPYACGQVYRWSDATNGWRFDGVVCNY